MSVVQAQQEAYTSQIQVLILLALQFFSPSPLQPKQGLGDLVTSSIRTPFLKSLFLSSFKESQELPVANWKPLTCRLTSSKHSIADKIEENKYIYHTSTCKPFLLYQHCGLFSSVFGFIKCILYNSMVYGYTEILCN